MNAAILSLRGDSHAKKEKLEIGLDGKLAENTQNIDDFIQRICLLVSSMNAVYTYWNLEGTFIGSKRREAILKLEELLSGNSEYAFTGLRFRIKEKNFFQAYYFNISL